MPEPISGTLILIAVASVFFGGTVATVIAINWTNIMTSWKGKRLAVLGAEASGKSMLSLFLTQGQIPDEYMPTLVSEPTRSNRYQLDELELFIQESIDVPGVEVARDQWKLLIEKSQILLYLVRADKLLSGDTYTLNRIRSDAQLIRTWLPESSVSECFIIGTWADKIPGYRKLKGRRLVDLGNKFSNNSTLAEAVTALRIGNIKVVHVLIGSQERASDQQKLVTLILKSLEAK